MQTIEIDGSRVAYDVRRSARARNARVVSHPWRGLEVVLPRRAPARTAEDLLRRHARWVLRESLRVPALPPLGEGSLVPLRGMQHRLGITQRARAGVRHAPGAIQVSVPHARDAAAVRAVLERWLRAQARDDLEREVDRAERVLGVRRRGLAIRDQRSRYGSCSAHGLLSFSWRLVLAPPPILRYVAAHEVAHLAEPNHGAGFWMLVERADAGHREARRWLRAHSATLRF